MNPDHEPEDWDSSDERQKRIRHEKIDNWLTLLLREPPLDSFIRNIDTPGLISISCIYRKSAEVIRENSPQINELYTLFDFTRIFKSVKDTKVIRDCLEHFEPQTVILESTLFENLPSDLLSSFLSYSPQKLIILIEGLNQQFLIKRFKSPELRFEHPPSWIAVNDSALALNSILQSATNLESLELCNCPIDDFTVTAFGFLCLEKLFLYNVNFHCRKINALISNLTNQQFMKSLVLRFKGPFQPKTLSFLVQLMKRIQKIPLESLEISISNDFYKIDNIILIPSLKFLRINIVKDTSIQTINYVEKAIATRSNIKYEIHGFSPIQCKRMNLTGELFNIYFNRLPHAVGSWGPWWRSPRRC